MIDSFGPSPDFGSSFDIGPIDSGPAVDPVVIDSNLGGAGMLGDIAPGAGMFDVPGSLSMFDAPSSSDGALALPFASTWAGAANVGSASAPSSPGFLDTALDGLGKLWNAPNTLLGLAYGGIGHLAGWGAYALGLQDRAPSIGFGDNAIQFSNNPFGGAGAITLGNAQVFSGSPNDLAADGNRIGEHEMQHTYQGQLLGPLYLPSNLLGGLSGLLFGGDWHAPQNWNEVGPQQNPPRPW